MPGINKSREELPWLYYPRSNSVRVINSHLDGSGGGGALLLDTYTGAAAAYSLRKLRSAQTNCIRVRRTSDNAEQDIGFAGNSLDTSALTTFCGANDGVIATWYDQSGNDVNVVSPNTANQSHIVTAGSVNLSGSFPAAIGDNASGYSGALASSFSSAECFIAMVASATTGTGNTFSSGGLASGSNNTVFTCVDPFHFREATSDWGSTFYGDGSNTTKLAFSPYSPSSALCLHVLERRSATSFRGYQNGTLGINTDAATSRTVTATHVVLMQRSSGSAINPFNGDFCEFLVWPSSQESNRAAISSAIATHYGITLS